MERQTDLGVALPLCSMHLIDCMASEPNTSTCHCVRRYAMLRLMFA